MKRLLQLFLAGVFLISFTAHARVILPKGGEQWSVGSSVQLQWDATGDTVDIQLIRQGKDPIVIAENVADTGHYLWPIEELETARDYKIEITQGAKTLTSRPFRITAWDAKRYLGEFDENDRSRVTHPRQAAVLDKGNPTVTVNWVDYRHFLKNKVRISLHEVGKLRALGTQTQLDNIGSVDWQLDKSAIKDCTEGLCYFVVRSGRKRNHLITSHSFTLGDVGDGGGIEITEADVGPSEDSAAAGSVLTLGWTGPEGEIRIDLYQAGYYHQTIKEEAFSPDDEGKSHLSWPIPAPLPGGEDYTVVLTSLADGAKQATSTPFSIEAAEDSVTVNSPKDITLTKAAKRARLGWKNTKGPVDIDLYRDGRRVKTIARNTSPNRVHNWPLPGVLAGSDQYTVRVSQADDEGVFGVSALFSITPPGGGAVTQAPSAKRCQALGLAEGCTAGEATVARLALERDCVTWRLYGTACTKKAVEGVIEKLLARADDRPMKCQAGWIQIGNQCRPEADCPGLALRDEERPQWLRDSREGEKKGRRRCDQNLLKIENSVDLTIAELMNMWNRLLETKDGDFSELMDDFYAAIHKQDSDNREFKPYRTCRSKDYYRQEVFDYTLDKERRLCKTEDPNDLIHEDFETRRSSCDTEKELKKDRLESEYFQTRLQSPCDPWVRKLSILKQIFEHRMGESFSKFIPKDFQMRPFDDFKTHVTNHILSIGNSGGDFQYAWESSTKGMLYWPAHAIVSESAESALPPAARIHARFLRLVAEYQKTRARAGEPWYDGFVSKSDAGSRKWRGFSRHFKRAGFRKVEDCNEYRGGRCEYDQGMDRIPKEILWPGQPKLFGEEWPELTDFIASGFGSDEFELKEFLAGLDEAQLEKIRQLIRARGGYPELLNVRKDSFELDFTRVAAAFNLDKGELDSLPVVSDWETWEQQQAGYADDVGAPYLIKRVLTGVKGKLGLQPGTVDFGGQYRYQILNTASSKSLLRGKLRPALPMVLWWNGFRVDLFNIHQTTNFSSRLYPLEAPKPVVHVVSLGSAVRPFSQQVEADREWLDQGLPDSEKISAKLINWAKDKAERRSYGIDNYGQSFGFIADPTSSELIPKYLDSALAAKSRSVLSCPAGYGVEDGACKQCAPGYFKPYTKVNSGPCQICTGNVISKGQGSTSCEVCPFGQVPNRDYTACMSNPCTGKNQYWDLATRRCEKSARRRHKWVQMDYYEIASDISYGQYSNKDGRNQDILDSVKGNPQQRRDFIFQRCTVKPPLPICESAAIRPESDSFDIARRPVRHRPGGTHVFRNLLRGSLAQLDASIAESGRREKGVFSLHVDGHGSGFQAAGIEMNDMRRVIREELGDGRLSLMTFYSCDMANYETLAMLEGTTDWVLGSIKTLTPGAWQDRIPFNLMLKQKTRTKFLSPKEELDQFIEELDNMQAVEGYQVDRLRAYEMEHFSGFKEAFDDVLDRLADLLEEEKDGYFDTLRTLYHVASNHLDRQSPAKRQQLIERFVDEPKFGVRDGGLRPPPRYRYDVRSFLQAFENDSDNKLKGSVKKALKKLNILTKIRPTQLANIARGFEMSFFWRKRSVFQTTGHRNLPTSQWIEGLPSSRVESFPLSPYGLYGASYTMDEQGRPKPGWEPLRALFRFNRAWETAVSGGNLGYFHDPTSCARVAGNGWGRDCFRDSDLPAWDWSAQDRFNQYILGDVK